MKNLLTTILAFYSLVAFSQEKLTSLTTPTSPAASILGMQPSVMLKPKSLRAVEAALYSNFSDGNGNGVIPNDFGLEFMPYWAENRGITLEDYLFPKNELVQLIRNSSFSLASTQKFLLQDSTETKSIALGYRTSLFFGNKKDKDSVAILLKTLRENSEIKLRLLMTLDDIKDNNATASKKEYIDGLKKILPKLIAKELNTKTQKEINKISATIYEEIEDLKFDEENTNLFFEGIIETTKKNIGDNYEQFKAYIAERQGLSLDFASAIHLNFPDNNFEFSEVPKYSLWLSPSYNFSEQLSFLKASGTIRYERYFKHYFEKYFPNSNVFDNNIDYGISVSGNFKKFTIEFEATGRISKSLIEVGQDSQGNSLYIKKSLNDTQYLGTFSYRLTEQIALSYQFGSAFKPIFNVNGGTLISILSLNLGFGGPNKSDVTTTK